MVEKKPYTPPTVRTVECFCLKGGAHHRACPVARIGRFRILTPDDFIELYGDLISGLLEKFVELFPESTGRWLSTVTQIRADLDVMRAPICPRCYERDGSLVQTASVRRLCVPCSRDQEP